MRNRDVIKEALVFSIRNEAREQCKNKGLSSRKTDEFLEERKNAFDQLAELALTQYDDFLIGKLAIELGQKLKDDLKKDNDSVNGIIDNLVEVISKNHENIGGKIRSLTIYHRTIREKILEEEIIHLESDCELLCKHKEALDLIAEERSKKVSWMFFIISILIFFGWGILIYRYEWDNMEMWTYMSGLGLIILNLGYYLVFNKKMTNEQMRSDKLEKEKNRIYKLYKFEQSLIDKNKSILEKKKIELETMSN